MKDGEGIISVIIPVFRTEYNLLQRCIESILNSSYKAIEIVIIDDGNDVEYANKLNQFISSNIKVIHKKHKGLSAARNTGLSIARGEYISFVDADDMITNYYFEEAIKMIQHFNLDIAVGGVKFVDAFNDQILLEKHYILKDHKKIEVFSKEDIFLPIANLFMDDLHEKGFSNLTNGSVSWKLYNKRCINDIRFDEEIHLLEDRVFNIQAFSNANKIGFTDSIWYLYYQYNYSLIHSYHENSLSNMSIVFRHCINCIKKYPGIEKYASRWMMSNIYTCIYLDLLNKKNPNGFIFNKNRLSKWFKSEEWKEAKRYFSIESLPLHTKIAACLCIHDEAFLMLTYYTILHLLRSKWINSGINNIRHKISLRVKNGKKSRF